MNLIYSQNKIIEPCIHIDCFINLTPLDSIPPYICLHVILPGVIHMHLIMTRSEDTDFFF